MKKLYFLVFFLWISFSYAQTSSFHKNAEVSSKSSRIDGLKMYPNPVTNKIINIVSAKNSFKTIQIFNILGKQVLFKGIKGKELDVSKLDAGIYIVKIREKDKVATRKLVIK